MRRDVIGEIKARVSVGDVLHDAGVKVSRGRGTCPLHSGKNPFSFSVKGDRWKCFSCNEGGDIITLTALLHNLTTGESIRRLAIRAGIKTGPLSPKEREAMKRARAERERRAALKKKYADWIFEHEKETALCLRTLRQAKARWEDFTLRGLERLASLQAELNFYEYFYSSVFCGKDEAARLALYTRRDG